MARKSVQIAQASSGEYVAFEEMTEIDDSSNPTLSEMLVFGSLKGLDAIGFPKRGNLRTLAFTSGGTYEVLVGDTIEGASSGATARIVSITVSTGSWAGADAAGTFYICDQDGTFQSENLDVGANGDVATIAGNSSASTLTAADTFDLTALPAELTQNLITVGDRSLLVVSVEQYTTAGTCVVTPLIFDNQASPGVIGVLPPKTFTQPYAFRRGSASGTYVLPVQLWDVVGSYKIGLHMSAITGTSNYVYIYGWVI